MSQFSSRDVMVTVMPEGAVGEISWDGIQACKAGGATSGTCTTCTNRSTKTKRTKSAARELALLKAQLHSIR